MTSSLVCRILAVSGLAVNVAVWLSFSVFLSLRLGLKAKLRSHSIEWTV